MIGFFVNIFRVAFLLAICSNATALAMITIGDNGLKEATYYHLSPEGYREIRLVSKSWAQYNNEPQHLYDSYSKDGKISTTCAFLVCVHKNAIFDTEMFLRHTSALALLNQVKPNAFSIFPFVSALQNRWQPMTDLLLKYSASTTESINYNELTQDMSSNIDYYLCSLASDGNAEMTNEKFNFVVNRRDEFRAYTIDFVMCSIIQNYDLELLKTLLKFRSCKKYIENCNNDLLESIILGYDADTFDKNFDFSKLTLTAARSAKIKKFIDSGVFNLKKEMFSGNNYVVKYLEKIKDQNPLFEEIFLHYQKAMNAQKS